MCVTKKIRVRRQPPAYIAESKANFRVYFYWKIEKKKRNKIIKSNMK